MYVRAADVNFEPADLVAFIKFFAGVCIILNGETGNVCHNFFVKAFCKFRKFFADNFFNARVLKANCIDHSGGAFRNSGGGVSESRFLGGSFEGESSEHVDIIEFGKFIAVAESSGSGDNGVIHFDSAKIYF